MNLEQIARLCGASHMLNRSLAATPPASVVIDSRVAQPGDLFVAIPGERVDGHTFVREVFDKGASAALVVHHRLPFATELGVYADKLLFVEHTLCALQQLAARVLAAWNKPVVGVTGSAGKTTIKDLTAHVLGGRGNVLKSLGNLNTGYGLPLTVTRMIAGNAKPEEFDLAVLEMGMSSFGEIARLVDLAPPQVGIVGNVGTAHLEFFGSPERIARAKAELVDGIRPGGTAVLNADDARVIAMKERRADINVVSFGIEAPANVMARDIVSADDLSYTRFVLQIGGDEAETRLPLIGRHNVANALAAAGAASALGMSVTEIAERLATAAASKMRGELIRFANGVTVIDDSYNSNPPALLHAVRALLGAKGFRRRIVVAGEMLELGAQAADMHRECGREIAVLPIDWLLGVRGLAHAMVEAASGPVRAEFYATPEEAAEQLIAEARPGDLVLIKGSRGVRMEKIVASLRATFG